MGAQKKGPSRVSDDHEPHVPLQAILLADSFATTFRPITQERPKVLLPLVNAPMIDYTLTWLESAGVEEVFVFCCAHSGQVIDYLENSEWRSHSNSSVRTIESLENSEHPNFSVWTIESHGAISAGDAMRLIYEQNVIPDDGDFVLISGDTVSNMSLTKVLQEHRERKQKDRNAVMTMVIKRSKPSQITHQSRLGSAEIFMAIDPDTKQLLYYEDKADDSKAAIYLDKLVLADKNSISLHNDRQDCYIDICSQEVLSLFTDNFDYQHLRRHFVKGLLHDDIMDYKIFTHEIHSSYAARLDNFRSYDTISKDIIQRWTFPFVPDVMSGVKLERQGMYRASDITLSHSANIGPLTVIGKGTKIGNKTSISNSVIGEGCSIGSNVSVEGSYIWNNVTIEDGCKLRHAIICDGVIMKSGAVLEPGVVLSFKVVIGQQFIVPSYSMLSLFKQPVKQDSDEELEYADHSTGIVDIPSMAGIDEQNGELTSELMEEQCRATSQLGAGGVGYIWSFSDGAYDEEWRHSVAPILADKLAEITLAMDDDLEFPDDSVLPPSGELRTESICSEGDEFAESRVDSVIFEKEVVGTFQRAVDENIKVENVILEVNSLRLSFNMIASDCAGAVFYSMMKWASENSNSASELLKNASSVTTKWKKLLKYYLADVDDEIEVILKFEDMCAESTKEFSPLFTKILEHLYDQDVIKEISILKWNDEKENADEADKVFVRKAEKFITWLKEASEEDEDDD